MPSNNFIFQRVHESQFLKPTNDDWHPSIEGGFCEVRGFVGRRVKSLEAATNTAIPFWAKISVSGVECDSLEYEMSGTLEECTNFYQYWIGRLVKMPIVSQNDLKNFGFVRL